MPLENDIKAKVKIYDAVTERSGKNDKGPWSMREQSAEVDCGHSQPSQPFNIRLQDSQVPYKSGLYSATLRPQQGKFRGSLEWVFTMFEPAKG